MMENKKCGDCIHKIICKKVNGGWFSPENFAYCQAFKDRTNLVEVVRCKDCKHYDNSEGIQWCKINSKFYRGGVDWHGFPEDGFCSYGERKGDGNG